MLPQQIAVTHTIIVFPMPFPNTNGSASAIPPQDPYEGSPTVRRMVLWASRRCLRWMYREIRVVGADRVPDHGPLLLIGNHPNDLPDVMLGYLATRRRLRYIATVAAASNILGRSVYRALGVVPVARARDARMAKRNGINPTELNAQAGVALAQAFDAGHAVGLFPEGGVHHKPYLMKPKSGVAKMILNYFDNGAKKVPCSDLTIVPFGIQYEAPQTQGSDCCIVFGAPLSLAEWIGEHRETGIAPATSLAATFYDGLWAVTRNAPSFELADSRDRLVATVAATAHGNDPLRLSLDLVQTAQNLVRHSMPHGSNENDIRPHAAETIISLAHVQAQAVERAGGIPTSARDHTDFYCALKKLPIPRSSLWWLIAMAPVAAMGGAIHYLPLRLGRALAKKLAQDPTEIVARTFLPGALFVPAWYVVLALLIITAASTLGIGLLYSLALILTAPRLGDFAFSWQSRWRRYRLVRRVSSWSDAKRLRLIDVAESVRREWTNLQEQLQEEHPKKSQV